VTNSVDLASTARSAGHGSRTLAMDQLLEELVEAMTPLADVLTAYVRAREQAAVHDLLGPLDALELRALAVVLADKRRWGAEEAFTDWVAIERAVTGEPVRLTRVERAEAAVRIVASGGGASQLVKRLRVSGATARQLLAYARHQLALQEREVRL